MLAFHVGIVVSTLEIKPTESQIGVTCKIGSNIGGKSKGNFGGKHSRPNLMPITKWKHFMERHRRQSSGQNQSQ